MNKLYTILLTVLMALASTARTWAEDGDFSGKILSVGSTITSLETGKWYYLYNQATGRYVTEGSGNTLGLTATSPSGLEADSYLVRLESAGEDGKYYLQTALGNYYSSVTTSKNNGTEATKLTKGIYTIAQFSGASGHWSLRSNGMYYLQDNNGMLKGSASQGSAGSDRDWALREVVLKNVADLTGTAYIRYVLGKGGLVRLANRRLPNANLAQIGSLVQGTQALESDLAQVWILAKSGDGYTLRNASTGSYLDSEDNFRTPSSSAVRMYIQASPNNTGASSYINLSTEAGFEGNVCLNLNGDGTTLYKWTCQNDQGSDWSISLVENFTLEEVEAGLLAGSKYKTPVAGKYYRLQNLNYKSYMYEGITSHGTGCEALNEEKLAQYWTLVQVGS